MEYEDVRQAAVTLATELRQFPWLRFVGVGEENSKVVFIVYVSKKKP